MASILSCWICGFQMQAQHPCAHIDFSTWDIGQKVLSPMFQFFWECEHVPSCQWYCVCSIFVQLHHHFGLHALHVLPRDFFQWGQPALPHSAWQHSGLHHIEEGHNQFGVLGYHILLFHCPTSPLCCFSNILQCTSIHPCPLLVLIQFRVLSNPVSYAQCWWCWGNSRRIQCSGPIPDGQQLTCQVSACFLTPISEQL